MPRKKAAIHNGGGLIPKALKSKAKALKSKALALYEYHHNNKETFKIHHLLLLKGYQHNQLNTPMSGLKTH